MKRRNMINPYLRNVYKHLTQASSDEWYLKHVTPHHRFMQTNDTPGLIRISCVMPVDDQSLFEIVSDIELQNQWDFHVSHVVIDDVEDKRGRLSTVYQCYNRMYMLWPRDVVVLQQSLFSSNDHCFITLFKSVDHIDYPITKQYVRCGIDGLIKIKNLGTSSLLEIFVSSEYGGWIPSLFSEKILIFEWEKKLDALKCYITENLVCNGISTPIGPSHHAPIEIQPLPEIEPMSTPSLDKEILEGDIVSEEASSEEDYFSHLPFADEIYDKFELFDLFVNETGWKSVKSSPIQIEIKDVSSGSMATCRGTADIPFPPWIVKEFISVPEYKKYYDEQRKDGVLVARYNEYCGVYHEWFKRIFPTTPREVVYAACWKEDADGTITTVAFSIDHPDANAQSGHVRMILECGGWLLRSIEGGNATRATYVNSIDLNGSLPSSIKKSVANKAPLVVLGVSECMQSPTMSDYIKEKYEEWGERKKKIVEHKSGPTDEIPDTPKKEIELEENMFVTYFLTITNCKLS
eukprot:TRINITY_DN4229_c0_g1_i1.p1 TRINITY_DN4229_c0_g1~~TRINITY_DN4229_c0_g1_i1.p1  ORF type:complete len:519 (-),score=105.39 TRINITY_DN4229_c0_g1_i1:622-2178(-)